jgi:hypothetical protein
MRLLYAAVTPLLLGSVALSCNTVDADQCWRNTSSGSGGGGTIPIGAGVGATSGGDLLEPPREPLDNGEAPNPCVASATPSEPDEGGSEQSTYIRCLGLGPTACALQCNAIGAHCVEYAIHPEDPSQGAGALKQCASFMASSTCSYCYSNGDVCTFIYMISGMGLGRCTNTGGKGCE